MTQVVLISNLPLCIDIRLTRQRTNPTLGRFNFHTSTWVPSPNSNLDGCMFFASAGRRSLSFFVENIAKYESPSTIHAVRIHTWMCVAHCCSVHHAGGEDDSTANLWKYNYNTTMKTDCEPYTGGEYVGSSVCAMHVIRLSFLSLP